MSDVEAIISGLGLQPHPEGGHYLETWRAEADVGERPSGSAIHCQLRAGERSAWHRVDAAETWHYYPGDPLELSVAPGNGRTPAEQHLLGADLDAGQVPQLAVPNGAKHEAVHDTSPARPFNAANQHRLSQPGME